MKAPVRVLLVDGHQGVREGLSNRLRRDPMMTVVAAASSLSAALRAAWELAPDVILCDPSTIGGAGTQGIPEVVRRLSSLGPPLVVLIPSLQEGQRADLWRAGAAAILLKGCRFPELLAALEQGTMGHAPGRTACPRGPQAGVPSTQACAN